MRRAGGTTGRVVVSGSLVTGMLAAGTMGAAHAAGPVAERMTDRVAGSGDGVTALRVSGDLFLGFDRGANNGYGEWARVDANARFTPLTASSDEVLEAEYMEAAGSSLFVIGDKRSDGGEGEYWSVEDGSSGLWVSPANGEPQLLKESSGGTYDDETGEYVGRVSVEDLVTTSNKAFFTVNDGEESGLWVSDGTSAGTKELEAPDMRSAVAAGNRIFFTSQEDRSLWVSDGTSAGTRQLVDSVEHTSTYETEDGPSTYTWFTGPSELTAVGDQVFFVDAAEEGVEALWKTDGSTAGTALLKETDSSDYSGFTRLRVAGDKLIFGAEDELWTTDGTTSGTKAFLSTEGLGGFMGSSVVASGSKTFFMLDDAKSITQLWSTDGTRAGTQQLTNFGEREGVSYYEVGLAAVAGKVYFAARDGVHGEELWVSNGTKAGTQLAVDLRPGGYASNPTDLSAAHGKLWFTADLPAHGRELWRLGVAPAPKPTPKPTPKPAPKPAPDTKLVGPKASATAAQKQGKKVAVKVRAGAAEQVTIKVTGSVKIRGVKGKVTLKGKTVKVAPGKQSTISLSTAKKKDRSKLLKAVQKARKAKSKAAKTGVKATMKVTMTDAAGNSWVKSFRVTLK